MPRSVRPAIDIRIPRSLAPLLRALLEHVGRDLVESSVTGLGGKPACVQPDPSLAEARHDDASPGRAFDGAAFARSASASAASPRPVTRYRRRRGRPSATARSASSQRLLSRPACSMRAEHAVQRAVGGQAARRLLLLDRRREGEAVELGLAAAPGGDAGHEDRLLDRQQGSGPATGHDERISRYLLIVKSRSGSGRERARRGCRRARSWRPGLGDASGEPGSGGTRRLWTYDAPPCPKWRSMALSTRAATLPLISSPFAASMRPLATALSILAFAAFTSASWTAFAFSPANSRTL